MAGKSVPIPPTAQPAAAHRAHGGDRRGQGNNGVVRSSLELVFSYSRSQQRFFHGLPSAPSFVDYQWADEDAESDTEHHGEWDHESRDGYSSHEEQENAGDESEADFFPDDPVRSDRFDRRTSSPLTTVTERDEVLSPTDTIRPGSSITPRPMPLPLPAKRGGLLNMFGTTPTVPLSSSVTSSNGSSSKSTPKIKSQPLPEDSSSGLSRSWAVHNKVSQGENAAAPTENTPLLSAGPVAQNSPRSVKTTWAPETYDNGRLVPSAPNSRPTSRPNSRRPSRIGVRPTIRPPIVVVGESSDGQTLFNAIAVLVGIGLLSMPLAFSYAGWIGGAGMLIGFSFITCYTAKLLSRLMFADPTLNGYTDIGRKAFGPWAGGMINVLFCTELFALGVALIVLFGDSLNAIYPNTSAEMFMALGFFLVVPTTFMPLNLLSIPSILSTFATVLLIGIVVFDGLYLAKAPGSIRDPMPTSLGPDMKGMNWLGGIGLVLAGFGGHAVIPSIAKDMRNHQSMERVFNIAFFVAGAVAFIAGAAGYLMFGDTVSDEITRDLMKPKYGYPVLLNLFAVWMIVVNPLTKFGLCSRPLNVAVEGFLNLAPAPRPALPPPRNRRLSVTQAMSSAISTRLSGAGASDYLSDESGLDGVPKSPVPLYYDPVNETAESRKGFWRIVSRTIITLACTATAILLPGFERVMAFLGSFSSFLICIILPLGFYLRLAPKLLKIDTTTPSARIKRTVHLAVIAVSTILMGAGTVWAFLPTSGRTHDD